MSDGDQQVHRRRSTRPRPDGPRGAQTLSRGELRQQLRWRRSEEVRRSFGLTALSTVLPGLGLLFTRRRRFGMVLVAFTVIVLGYFGYRVATGGLLNGAAQLLTPKGLALLLVVFGVGGVLWIFGIMLTARETRRRGWSIGLRRGQGLFTAVMCLLVALPAATATEYVLVTQGAFDKMFTDRFDGRGNRGPGPGDGADPWADVPRVNILLLGSDAGDRRDPSLGVRTDSMMVASIDTQTGDSTLISIPRNLQNVPFPEENPLHEVYPDGFNCGVNCLMDGVWQEANANHRDKFGESEQNPGLNTTREVIEEITGLPIYYTTVINLSGFQQLVDEMGGVTMTVPEPGIPIGGKIKNGREVPGSVTGTVEPGTRKLNGYEALWYSRSRVRDPAGDNGRMQRQRCMVNALISQTNPVSMLQKFPGIMKVAGDSIQLDIPRDDLDAFTELVQRMQKGHTRSVNLGTGVVNTGKPDFDEIRTIVTQATTEPPVAPEPSAGEEPTDGATPTDATTSTDDESGATASSPSSSKTTQAITATEDSC